MAEVTQGVESVGIEKQIRDAIQPMLGLQCCRLRVGRSRSLSLGFGTKEPHGRPDMPDPFYGAWEVGTYSGAWRFVREGAVLCGSQELADSIEELDQRAREKIQPGRVIGITMLSPLDVRLVLDNMFVDILAMSSDTVEDELFHVFGPDKLYIECSTPGTWKLGRSDTSWR
jgi:hypothetical protein